MKKIVLIIGMLLALVPQAFAVRQAVDDIATPATLGAYHTAVNVALDKLDDNDVEIYSRLDTSPALNLTTDTVISATQILENQFITNQGASGEIDITLPAISYSATRTVIVEETQIIEVNPPSGEVFDLSGTNLDADDCIDSPNTVGAKAVFTRMQNASGTWIWSVDTVRGTWADTGASD